MTVSAPITAPAAAIRYWPAALFIVGALTVLRYLTLETSALNLLPDEAQYWAWAQTLDFGYFSKPPMIAWVIAASTALCGDGEACVRAASPLMHALTAMLVFAIGRELAGDRVGFWSSIAYATLPGVSFSALLISTDVPLLLFWALALLVFVRWLRTGALLWAAVLGLSVGLGLLSKYAMAYFVLCAAIYLVLSREARRSVSIPQAVAALSVSAAILVPNLLWNIRHGWATVEHTAANANWSGNLFNPAEALEFFGAQAGVFGPVLLAALALRIALVRRMPLSEGERLLCCFSLPVLAIVFVQAFISRAHANWAAPAYVAGCLLVTGWLLGSARRGVVLIGSTALHTAFALILSAYASGALAIDLPKQVDPIFSRQRGWDVLGREISRELASRPGWTLVADERKLMAELVYYTRAIGAEIAFWDYDRPAQNFFEATSKLRAATGERVLLVTADPEPAGILARFQRSRFVRNVAVQVGPVRTKTWRIYELEGFRAQ